MRRKQACAAGLILLLGWPLAAAAQLPLRFVAGQDYQVLEQPLPAAESGVVDVIEFFLYACSHCYDLDDAVTEWAGTLPEHAHFRRVPVLFGNHGEAYARLFYAADNLGVLELLHSKTFTAIHKSGRRLTALPAIARFMAEASNISEQSALDALDSESVDRGVAESVAAMRAFRVTAVPSLGIAGKYWVTARMAGSNDAMFEVADYLIRREKASQ
jgi:thiol:disulfide interchange protein DsbA